MASQADNDNVQPRRTSRDTFALRKPLDKMTPEELCEEALSIRGSIESAAERLNGIYSTLYTLVRRTSNDMTYAYLSVANSGKRLSGMILQASRRTASTEGRAILLAQREVEAKDRLRLEGEAKRKATEERKKKERVHVTDPLEAMFGIPLSPTVPVEFDSITQGYIDASAGPSSDLDDLYGEELG